LISSSLNTISSKYDDCKVLPYTDLDSKRLALSVQVSTDIQKKKKIYTKSNAVAYLACHFLSCDLSTRILSYHYSTDLPFIPQSSVQSTLDLWNLTFLFPKPLLFFKMGWKFTTSTTPFISSCAHTTALVSYQ
jgi:hypothetical protein